MALLLDSLKPTDTVAIAVYAGAAGEVLAPTPVREKEKILRALNSLRPGGSTAGAAGIRLAYELARRNFREYYTLYRADKCYLFYHNRCGSFLL